MFLIKYVSNSTCFVFFFILLVCQFFFSFDHYTVVCFFCICLKILILNPIGFPRALYFILVFQGHCILYWLSKCIVFYIGYPSAVYFIFVFQAHCILYWFSKGIVFYIGFPRALYFFPRALYFILVFQAHCFLY